MKSVVEVSQEYYDEEMVCFFIIIFLAMLCFLLEKKSFLKKKDLSRELLQTVTFEERESLSEICKGLFYTSPFGYTLFGDKPISVICNSGNLYKNDEMSFFQKNLFDLAQRYEKGLDAPNFAIVVEHLSPESFIYLINKKAFLNVVEQNIKIFRDVLGQDISPGKLLKSVQDKNFGLEKALKGNHALFGILLDSVWKIHCAFTVEINWILRG